MTTPRKKRSYSVMDKQQAALSVMVHGTAEKAAKQLGIPARTIRDWRAEPEWAEHMAAVRSQYDAELEEKLGGVIRQAVDVVEDRLQNGDYVFNKGELVRKPMNGKDTAIVGAVFFDKQRLIRNQPTTISGNVDERLAKLMDHFTELGRQVAARTIQGEVVDSETGPKCLPADSGER